jgi:hypothetical protein
MNFIKARLRVFTAVKIEGEVLWGVTPCSVVVYYSTRRHTPEDLDLNVTEVMKT